MTDPATRTTRPGLLGRATLVLAGIAGAFLLFMVALIGFGVIMRYVVGQPILGVNEILQLTAVALAMLAMPYATQSGAHVRADILDPALGRWGRLAGDIITRVLSIIALCVLIDRAWGKAADALEFGDSTNMLGLPLWPVFGMIAAGMSLCVLVFAAQILVVLITRNALDD
ncbi:MAG: TRAP transporter small permease [Oricola sp.]